MKQGVTFVQAKRESSHSNIKKVLTQHMHLFFVYGVKFICHIKTGFVSFNFVSIDLFLLMHGELIRTRHSLLGRASPIYFQKSCLSVNDKACIFVYKWGRTSPPCRHLAIYIPREILVSRNISYKSNLEGWSSKKSRRQYLSWQVFFWKLLISQVILFVYMCKL